MRGKSTSTTWLTFFWKLLVLIGAVTAADRAAGWLSFEPASVMAIADSVSHITGLPERACFGLLLVLAAFLAIQAARAVMELFAAR